jgi:hypothetical protein
MRQKLAAHRALAAGFISAILWASSVVSAYAQFTPTPPDKAWLEKKAELTKLGSEKKTAWDLYQYFRSQAKSAEMPQAQGLPDWTGLWTRIATPFEFDPDQPMGGMPTAKLTPKYKEELDKILAMRAKGIEYDPISSCGVPPGMPRWLAEPFLRQFVNIPSETLLINEAGNDIRRVYTDGRGHPPKEDQYPLYNGDSIGFWDGDKLVVHTDEMMEGIYQRGQPSHSDEVETVEIWQKTADNMMDVYVWIYDPPSLVEPWLMRQRYQKLSNPKKELRIRYWACNENPNNDITQESNGASTFTDFTFTKEDDKTKGDKK